MHYKATLEISPDLREYYDERKPKGCVTEELRDILKKAESISDVFLDRWSVSLLERILNNNIQAELDAVAEEAGDELLFVWEEMDFGIYTADYFDDTPLDRDWRKFYKNFRELLVKGDDLNVLFDLRLFKGRRSLYKHLTKMNEAANDLLDEIDEDEIVFRTYADFRHAVRDQKEAYEDALGSAEDSGESLEVVVKSIYGSGPYPGEREWLKTVRSFTRKYNAS